METRANYILVGIFTLAGFLGLLAFFVWFARVELDRQFAYFDVKFSSVSGLSRASDVRFSGLPVGQVVHIGLSPDGDGTILVRLEVDAATPVRADSIATVEAQGVTGVSYVGISAGSPAAPLLEEVSTAPVPMIESGRSVIQSLTEDAPAILEEVLRVAEQLGEVLGPENQARVDSILRNLDEGSASFSVALEDFQAIANDVAGAAESIAEFTGRLDEVSVAVTSTLTAADTALLNVSQLATRAQGTLAEGDAALASATDAFGAAERVINEDLPRVVENLNATTEVLRTEVAALGNDARGVMQEFRSAGTAATARLNEAEATLAATDEMIARVTQTMDSVDQAAVRFDGLLAGDGAALVAQARTAVTRANDAIAVIGDVAATDLPEMMAEIRAAAEAARDVTERVGQNVDAASGRVGGLADEAEQTLSAVSTTFARAQQTLTAIETALETGQQTLAAAERAFEGADRVINTDIGEITGQLRETVSRLDAAVARVSEDIPAVTADLRAAGRSAAEAFDEVGTFVSDASPAFREFTSNGLPQFTRLAQEARNLIASLERISRQLEREPARFLLDRQTPEFRR